MLRAEEAFAYLTSVRATLIYVGPLRMCDMEKATPLRPTSPPPLAGNELARRSS